MTTNAFSFRELPAWQKAMALVKEVYHASAAFPKDEKQGLTDLVRRTAIALPPAAARLTGGTVDTAAHARGLLLDIENHLLVAVHLGYLEPTDLSACQALIDDLRKLIPPVRK